MSFFLRILDKYIIKELTLTFLAVLAVLLLITFGNEASRLLAQTMQGKVPSVAVLELLFLKLPAALEIIFPLVTLLAVILTFGRLYQDQEMVVLQSSAITPNYFKKIVVLFLIPIALLMAWISLVVTPWAFQQERELLSHAETISPVTGLEAGKFNRLPKDQGVLYTKEIDEEGRLKSIWLKLEDNQKDLLLTAPQGHFGWVDKRVVIVLENGRSYHGLANSDSVTVQSFERFEGYLPELTPEKVRAKVYEKTTLELLSSSDPEELAILQWRIATPIGLLILGMIGLKMSQTAPREGRFAKIFMALILYIVFHQLLVYGRDTISNEEWSTTVGLWPILIIFAWYAVYDGTVLKQKLRKMGGVKTQGSGQ